MARKTGAARQLEAAMQRNRDLLNENHSLRTQVANLKLVSPQGDNLSSLKSSGFIGGGGPVAFVIDAVNHPSHYTRGGIEVLAAIEAWGLGFSTGNAVKYIARAGHKDPSKTIEDLKKAIFYVQREVDRLEGKL